MKFSLQDRLRAWLPLLLPLFLLAGSYWLNQHLTLPDARPDGKRRHDIDIEIRGVTALTLDEHGLPHHQLSAERMWHYPDDETTHLAAPRLVSRQPDGILLTVTAESGRVNRDGSEIFLERGVRVLRQDAAAQTTTFITESLHLLPKEERADTDQAVTLTTPHTTISAVGMEMDWRARVIKLMADVRVNHDPAAH